MEGYDGHFERLLLSPRLSFFFSAVLMVSVEDYRSFNLSAFFQRNGLVDTRWASGSMSGCNPGVSFVLASLKYTDIRATAIVPLIQYA